MKHIILLLILTSSPAMAANSRTTCNSKTAVCKAVQEYAASHEASLFARVTVKLEVLNQVQDLSTGN
jgi:hypothetical protein